MGALDRQQGIIDQVKCAFVELIIECVTWYLTVIRQQAHRYQQFVYVVHPISASLIGIFSPWIFGVER